MFSKKSLICFFCITVGLTCFGQVQRNTGQITGGTYSGGTIEAFSTATETFPDENYLYPDWYYGSINLKGSDKYDVREIPMKINIVRNTIEFRQEKVVKEIDLAAVNSFRLLIPNKLEAVEFVTLENESNPTTYKIIYVGEKFTALSNYDHEVIPADYNAQFDTGSKVDRVKINQHFYIRNEDNNAITEVKINKRAIRNYFESNDPSAYAYIKKNKPALNDENDFYELIKKLDNQ